MGGQTFQSDAEQELQSRSRAVDAVGRALLAQAQSITGKNFPDDKHDPLVVAAIFQGLATLYGPIR
jgi:hypothetical protein